MSKVITSCLSWLCENTLDVMVTNDGRDSRVELTGGELCKECQDELDHPKTVKFNNQSPIQVEEPFEVMMAKRKLENRKKSGKQAPRGQR